MDAHVIATSKAPPAIGPYSQAKRVGDFIFTAGQVAIDPNTPGKLVPGGIKAQTEQGRLDLSAVLEAAGGQLQNVGNGRALLEHIFPGPLQALIPKVIAAANNALALSIGDLFWITIVSGVLGLACCLMLRDRPLKSGTELRSGAIAPD